MRFNNLSITNFMSVENVSTCLSDRGLLLVKGINSDADAFESNGASKSTIFSEAIYWCLYGQTIRGQKGDSIVNRFHGKNTCVSVEIVDDNGEVYRVDRYRKHNMYRNTVQIYTKGKNITKSSDDATNAFIVKLLQMDETSFANSIMFGQGMTKMFSSATDGEQKKILECMLQIDIFKECQDKAKEYLSKENSTRDGLVVKLNYDLKRIQDLEQSIKNLQDLELQMEETINKEVSKLLESKNLTLLGISELEDVEELNKLIHENMGNIVELKASIEGFAEQESSKYKLMAEIAALAKELPIKEKKLHKKVQDLEDVKNGNAEGKTCETCGQLLPTTDTTAIEAHISEEIAKLTQDIEFDNSDIKTFTVLLRNLKEKLKDKDVLQEKLEVHQDNITKYKVRESKSKTQYKAYTEKIVDIDKQIAKWESQRGTTYTELINSAIAEISALDDVVFDTRRLIETCDANVIKYNFWVNGFGNQGIKSVLLDSVTPFLNTRANYYLQRLADSSIEVKFNTQTTLKSGEKRDKFAVEVTNTNGDNDYKGNSGGEKRRIDLAVNMALQDLVGSRSNKKIDLIVYDEAFEGLDAIGCERLIEILEEKAKACGTIFVITHNDSLKDLFKKSITVKKENRVVSLIEGAG